MTDRYLAVSAVIVDMGVELPFYAAEGAGDVAVVPFVLPHEAADERDDDGKAARDDGDEYLGGHILTRLLVRRSRLADQFNPSDLGGGCGTFDVVNLNQDFLGHGILLVAVAIDVDVATGDGPGGGGQGECGVRRGVGEVAAAAVPLTGRR